jgi:ectoine hydroxylase-related dioxygenase (phytanoyl-CoA dioxygenase family)
MKQQDNTARLAEHRAQFEEHGYAVIKGLFSVDEAAQLRDHYMAVRAAGSYPGDMAGIDATSDDPLVRYPRMIHMHKFDQTSMDWMLSDQIAGSVEMLLGEPPLAAQTMIYFKPAGARGQALHQDQYYLRAAPGTCVAAWMALDEIDEANGCLMVVPGSHRLPILCIDKADTKRSFTDVEVTVPPGMDVVPVVMQPGDVFFFHGQLIHGSYPNTTKTRFRRALIAHFINSSAEKVADYYFPLVRRDGTEVTLKDNALGGPCGKFVDESGRPVLEIVETT